MAQMSAPQAPGYQEDPQKVGVHAGKQFDKMAVSELFLSFVVKTFFS